MLAELMKHFNGIQGVILGLALPSLQNIGPNLSQSSNGMFSSLSFEVLICARIMCS